MALRKIGEAVTGTNGKCVIPYAGVGVGRLQMIGQYEEDGRVIQSEIYEVEDCKFLDTFTTDTSNNYFLGGGSLSISDGVFHYTGSGTDSNNYFNIKGAVTPNINLFKGNTAIFKADVSNLPNGVTARVLIYQTVNGSTLPTYTDYNSSGLCSHSAFIDSNATAIVFRLQFLGLGSDTVDIDNFRVY